MNLKEYVQQSNKKKIFIKSKGTTKSWQKALLSHNNFLPNFKIDSLQSIALELISDISPDRQIQVINSIIGGNFVGRVLQKLSEKNGYENRYMPNKIITHETCVEIYDMYVKLECENALDEGSIILGNSEQTDLEQIFSRIEKEVDSVNESSKKYYITESKLLRKAIEKLDSVHSTQEVIFLIDASCEFSTLELTFLSKLLNGSKADILQINEQHSDEVLCGQLQALNVHIDKRVNLSRGTDNNSYTFSGYGIVNEIKQIFIEIQNNNYPIDTCEILFLSQNYYREILNQSHAMNISITSSSGTEVSNSQSYVLIQGIMNYINSDYDLREIEVLLKSVYLNQDRVNAWVRDDDKNPKMDEDLMYALSSISVQGKTLFDLLVDIHGEKDLNRITEVAVLHKNVTLHELEEEKAKLQDLIQSVNIIDNLWLLTFEKVEAFVQSEDIPSLSEKELNEINQCLYRIGKGKSRLKHLLFIEWLWVQNFNKLYYLKNKKIQIKMVLNLLNILIGAIAVNDGEEGAINNILKTDLKILEDMMDGSFDTVEASNINKVLGSSRTDKKTSEAGSLCVNALLSTAVLSRKNTFIVGLDSLSYPISVLDSPIISSDDLIQISPVFKTPMMKQEKISRSVENLLTTSEGNIWLGYSSYDIANCRIMNPSGLWSKYDEKQGNLEPMHFHTFKPKNSSEMMNPLAYLLLNQEDHFSENPHIESVVDEGGVSDREEQLEKTSILQMSATRMDTAYTCKYKYFMKYILKIPEIRKISNNQVWLAANEKGTLVHKIMELFVKELMKEAEDNVALLDSLVDKDNCEKAFNCLMQIADDQIALKKEIIPPKNSLIYENEKKMIFKYLKLYFYKLQKDYDNLWKPYAIEMKIEREVEITQQTKIHMLGDIDRVDVQKNSVDGKTYYRVVDYKTGSLKHFHIDQKAQNILYYKAVEQLIKDNDLEKGAIFESAAYQFIFDEVYYESEVNSKCIEKKNQLDDRLEQLWTTIEDLQLRRYKPITEDLGHIERKIETIETDIGNKERYKKDQIYINETKIADLENQLEENKGQRNVNEKRLDINGKLKKAKADLKELTRLTKNKYSDEIKAMEKQLIAYKKEIKDIEDGSRCKYCDYNIVCRMKEVDMSW